MDSHLRGELLYCPFCGHQGMTAAYKASSGNRRWRCCGCERRTTQPMKEPPVEVSGALKIKDITGTRFVVTSAQNNTEIWQPFHSALRVFAEDKKAQLMAVMVRYSNPDAMHKGSDAALKWPAEISDITLDKNVNLCAGLRVMGDVKVPATKKNPLGGHDMTGKQSSIILGHNQLQMRYVPTMQNEQPKQLLTTGTVSLKNYGRSDRARSAWENHNNCAIYVETAGPYSKKYWAWQLEADKDGGFYFLDKYYSPEGVRDAERPLALFIGDEHEFWLSDSEKKCLFGKGGIVETLKPEKLIRNDVYDHFAGSHHDQGNHIVKLQKQKHGYNDIRAELDATIKYLNDTTPDYTESCILDSNHNDHFMKWLNYMSRGGANTDMFNAPLYHEVMGAYMQVIEAGETVGPFEFYCRGRLNDNIRFIPSDHTFLIGGIDNANHGHRGANGARGGKSAFSKAVHKMNTGHSHTSFIEKGAWGAGTLALLRAGRRGVKHYASAGLSGWSGDHILIYKGGKRTMLSTINGWWRK